MPLPPLPLMTFDNWKPRFTVAWYENGGGADHDADHLIAVDRIGAGDVGAWIDAGVVEIHPGRLAERAVGVAADGYPRALNGIVRAALDRVGAERVDPLLDAADALEVGDEVRPVRVAERSPSL